MLPTTNAPFSASSTALWRRDPFRALRSGMERIFDESIARLEGSESLSGELFPAVDIRENGDHILLQADVPGIDKKDITVDVENGVLTLSGERKFEGESKKESCHRVERVYGAFMRSFSLPASADETKVDATYHNGVLSVRIPKRNASKTRAVDIKVV